MLTVCGFIEQENWMYAYNFEDAPGYRNTVFSRLNTIPVDEYWKDGSGNVEETDEYLLSLPGLYKADVVRREMAERQEKVRVKWLRQQWNVNKSQRKRHMERLEEGKLKRIWLGALDRHMLSVEAHAYRLNKARPKKLAIKKRFAEEEAYVEARERRRTELLIRMKERKKRMDAIQLQSWEEKLRNLIEQTRRYEE